MARFGLSIKKTDHPPRWFRAVKYSPSASGQEVTYASTKMAILVLACFLIGMHGLLQPAHILQLRRMVAHLPRYRVFQCRKGAR